MPDTQPPSHPLGRSWVWGPPIEAHVQGSQAGVRGAPESQLRGLNSSCWSAAQGSGNHTTTCSGQAPTPATHCARQAWATAVLVTGCQGKPGSLGTPRIISHPPGEPLLWGTLLRGGL